MSDATIMALAGHLSVKMKEKYSHTRTGSQTAGQSPCWICPHPSNKRPER